MHTYNIIMQMQFAALKKHIAENKPEPFYIVTGDDGYIVKKAAEMLRSFAGGLPEFNLHVFADNNNASDIVAACSTLPLLGGRVVVDVSNFTKDAAEIAKYLKTPSPDTILVIVAPSLSKNISAVVKFAAIVECDRLDEISLKKWVIKRCVDCGSGIKDDAAAKLVAYSDRFMSRIETETEKLAAYKYGGVIDSRDVEDLVAPNIEYKIYELGDAITAGRKEVACKALKSLLDSGPASYVISGLYSHFRRLLYSLICKDKEIAEYLGVKEFAVTSSRRQVAAIPPKKLKEICDRLQDADFAFKSGKITDTLAAEAFVSRTVIELGEI